MSLVETRGNQVYLQTHITTEEGKKLKNKYMRTFVLKIISGMFSITIEE